MRTNNAPKTFWHRADMACGIVVHRLYVNGAETPYFVHDAKKAGIGHWTGGDPVGLFGAGMGAQVRCCDGSFYRIAATLATFRNVTLAKMRAEQMALTA